MNHKEIISYINRVESTFAVDKWHIEKYQIWPWIRIKLSYFLLSKFMGLTEATKDVPVNSRSNYFKRKIDWKNRRLKHKLDDLILLKNIKRSDFLFVSFSENMVCINNVMFDKSLDPIINLLGEKNKFLYLYFNKDEEVSKGSKKICFDSYINRRNRIGKVEFSCDLKEYDLFLEQIKSDFKDFDFKFLELDSLIDSFRVFHSLVVYYDKIIKNGTKIKYCFTTCYFDYRILALNVACRLNDIVTVEMPHGVHSSLHVAYGNWNNVPFQGYSMLPNVFWSWSKKEATDIESWISPQTKYHKVYCGGNPWSNYWLDKKNENTNLTSSENKILFTLQPFSNLNDVIPTYILNALNQLSDSCKVYIKRHPRQHQTVEEILNYIKKFAHNLNFQLIKDDKAPLPVLLSGVKLHLTLYSSSVYEAFALGVPSIALVDHKEIFNELEEGSAIRYYDKSSESVQRGIRDFLFSEKKLASFDYNKNLLEDFLKLNITKI